MERIRDAIVSGTAEPGDFASMPIPESYRGVTVHEDDQGMF